MTRAQRDDLREAITYHPLLGEFMADPTEVAIDPAWEGGAVATSEATKHVDRDQDPHD